MDMRIAIPFGWPLHAATFAISGDESAGSAIRPATNIEGINLLFGITDTSAGTGQHYYQGSTGSSEIFWLHSISGAIG
jgi:hypothetical protein